jgi:tetratricopeptide (TPR) repeat protein
MKFMAFILILSAHAVLSQSKSARPEQLWEQGKSAYNDGRLQMALALFDECLRKAPGFLEAYLSRAGTREQLDDGEGALTDYSVYLETRPDHYDALFARASLRYRLGKYDQARDDYLKLLTLAPAGETTVVYYQQSPSAVAGANRIMTAQSMSRPLLYNYIGMTETKLKNYSIAVQWLDSAITLQPREPDYYVNRGLARQGLKDSLADVDFKKALSLNPAHTAALSNLSVKQRGKVDKPEVDYLNEAIDSDSTMLYPYLERAFQRMEGGYWEGAEEDYSSALILEKKDPEIWMGRAIAREKQNKFDEAYKDYTQCLRLKEDNVRAWVNRGNVLVKQNMFKEAIDDYTAALTFDSAFSSAYYNRAIARERLKQYDDACADLKQAEALGKEPEAKLREKVCK